MKQIYILLFVLIIVKETNAQVVKDEAITTSEYVEKVKRRDLFFNKDMKIVKENYYSESSQTIINTIYYNNDGEIDKIQGFKKYPKIYFDIDFKNGTYSFPEEKLFLKFKKRFIFDGIQNGKNIVVNYSNGIKNGKLIQTDYGVSGKNIVEFQKVDPRYLQFNIIKFYSELGTENSYKLFKGLALNYKENLLNGSQTGFFVNGKIKFQSEFKHDKILNYTSYSVDGSLISKIIADSNAIINKPYILNGTMTNDNFNKYIKNDELSSTGNMLFEDDFINSEFSEYENVWSDDREILIFIKEIYGHDKTTFPEFYEKFNTDKKDLKKRFDQQKILVHGDNPDALRVLLFIPKYYIKRYEFDRNDQSDLIFY